jgi:hypothetical protein
MVILIAKSNFAKICAPPRLYPAIAGGRELLLDIRIILRIHLWQLV